MISTLTIYRGRGACPRKCSVYNGFKYYLACEWQCYPWNFILKKSMSFSGSDRMKKPYFVLLLHLLNHSTSLFPGKTKTTSFLARSRSSEQQGRGVNTTVTSHEQEVTHEDKPSNLDLSFSVDSKSPD